MYSSLLLSELYSCHCCLYHLVLPFHEQEHFDANISTFITQVPFGIQLFAIVETLDSGFDVKYTCAKSKRTVYCFPLCIFCFDSYSRNVHACANSAYAGGIIQIVKCIKDVDKHQGERKESPKTYFCTTIVGIVVHDVIILCIKGWMLSSSSAAASSRRITTRLSIHSSIHPSIHIHPSISIHPSRFW
jgi:hypothetical protein